ncbi:serine hydrolase domain-containing protein [Mucilaginibacter sp. 22184]|uniref:serine hydrolase domain-containing protein n=1 Tax=Mucilaginibacter sp. 22184 TaxID=3453887 RepID=UPI003F8742FB
MKNILLLLFLLPLTSLAQQNYPATIDNFMQAQVNINGFNGNVLVARAGKVIYQKAFGYRNYDTKQLLDTNSVFELASVSKQFTAMGILMLMEKGKLSLTDTLRKFFPQLPYKGVTIQNLLTHTSGLPDYMSAMENKWDHKKIAFNDDMINFLASEKIPANFAPGKKFEYSNTGYAILASIIEKVSGLTYRYFMYKNIFGPLRMDHSQVYNTRRSSTDTLANYAYGYVFADSLKKYIIPDSSKKDDAVFYLDGISGDGTVNSTTGDLLKWDRAIKNSTLLSLATQNEMLSTQSLMDTLTKKYYGYGVSIGADQFGVAISHSGGWPGYHTILTRYPVQDITIIVLSNNESEVSAIAYGITGVLFDMRVALPYVHKEITVDAAILNKYLGSYSRKLQALTLNFDIIKKDGKLYRHQHGAEDVELKPESNIKFFYADGTDRQIEFETDKTGSVTGGWFINSGVRSELHKAKK